MKDKFKPKPTQIQKAPNDRKFHYYDYPFGYPIRRCTWTMPFNMDNTQYSIGNEITCKRCPISKPMVTIKEAL